MSRFFFFLCALYSFSYICWAPMRCLVVTSAMCSWKPDITFKIENCRHLCGLSANLDERSVEPGVIQQVLGIMDVIRHEVLFSKIYHARREVDDAYPFPMAITRRKMNLTVEPLRKFLLMLDHLDSMIRTSVLLFGNVLFGSKLF